MVALVAGMALAVSPAHTTLVAPASKTIEVRNTGARNVAVDVKRAATGLLQVGPARVVLRAGSRALLTVRARADARARPGDHELIVLLLARPVDAGRIPVWMRLGVRLRVRVPGRLVRRIDVRGVQVRRRRGSRVVLVTLVNKGNVTEQLRRRVTVTFFRGRRLLSRLRYSGARELFPNAAAAIALPYMGGVRGRVLAVVKAPGVERRYRVRL